MREDPGDAYLDRLVDRDALRAYLEAHLEPADTFTYERHTAGHSNETLFLTWGERDLVLRRPPPGETAETAHNVLREYRVIDALQDAPVPVPPTVLACEDESVIGSEFYLMERLRGDVLRNDEPDRFADPDHRDALGRAIIDGLVEIHDVDPDSVGLGDFGYPDGFTARQVDRWQEQYAWARDVTADEREIPHLEEVSEWLSANLPSSHPATLVHGDYKPDNLMVAPGSPPQLLGVFDWEMSTLGDPRTDLGWFAIYWYDEKDPDPAVPELTDTFMTRAGYPSRQELIDEYVSQTGITFENERFYRTLAVFKLGALGEMFYRRYLEGNSDDPMYPLMEERVPDLLRRAQRIIDGDEPL
ncbi:MAG: phosphotransferase family protein [Halodesulfurarchaeum sp.]